MPNNLTNQQFLQELEKRLSDFTEDEIIRLLELTTMKIPNRYKEVLLQLGPQQIHDSIKGKVQEIEEKKKINEQAEKIKKSLDKK